VKKWIAVHPTLGRTMVEARTWMLARAIAQAFFRCEPREVEVTLANGAGA
jgi:hypothetical protein